MQTFLPYKSFTESAACLDRQRLGKQRVEVLQILRAIHGETTGWVNHPATLMWRKYVDSLVMYGTAVCREWLKRGYIDNCKPKIRQYRTRVDWHKPPWLTNDFCRAHQSNLLRKDPVHYGQFGWDVPDDLPYIWPVSASAVNKIV